MPADDIGGRDVQLRSLWFECAKRRLKQQVSAKLSPDVNSIILLYQEVLQIRIYHIYTTSLIRLMEVGIGIIVI